MFQRFLTMILLLAATGAFAADTQPSDKARYYVPEVPSDIGQVEFYLMTVGVGEEVANRFGHTGIRVVDPASKTDLVYNWGKFYFDQAGFLWKFYRGALTYSMGIRTFQADVMRHMTDERRLVMEHLNLTTNQKRRLFEKIAWNSLPENREFQYQYWFRNCATIPRDYLDDVLEGQVRAKFFAEKTQPVYRDYVRGNLSRTPFVAPLLDVMMNGNIDRPLTAWDEMFLPQYLREHMLEMPTIDDEGNPVAGTRLLTDSTVILSNPEVFDRPFNDYAALAAPTFLSLLGALAMYRKKRRRAFYRLLGVGTLYWGLFSGIIGTTLLLNWAFSGHPDSWHNANLMLLWPLDLVLIPLGFRFLRTGTSFRDRWPVLNAGKFFAVAHVAAFAVWVGLAALGVIEQNIWQVALWFGVPALALFSLVAGLGFLPYEEPAKATPPRATARVRKFRTAR